MKFRKKPVEIEAVLYDGTFPLEFLGESGKVRAADDNACEVWNEPEGCWVRCPLNHWIIRGVQGEFYPCAPDIFNATYDPA